MRLETDGLTESQTALRRLPGAVEKASDRQLVNEAKGTQRAARSAGPSSHPSAPSSSAWVGRKGAAVVLLPSEPRAVATEFGMDRPSRGQRRTRRRQFRRNRDAGYVIGPAVEKRLRGGDDRLADDAMKATRKTFDRAGVPRG